ncbi:MAG: FtsX-like permease family protein [Candidatus Pacebacteria bacterium]|nr:FtsX-like permease family protein [Candidatus Paceibacterota bacterium]
MKSIKTALINLRRMPYKSMMAVLMISLTFFVGYSFSMFVIGSQQILEFFESQPQVIAFFQIQAEEDQIQQVVSRFEHRSDIDQLTVVSKQEALAYYRQDKKDNPLLLELVTADILPASIEVSTKTPDQLTAVKQELEDFDQIDDVVLQQEIVDKMISWTNSLRLVGLTTTGILALLSLLVIITIVSLKISHKKKSINIFRLIGAGSGFIITPFIWEGFIYGLLGSAIGWSLMYVGYLYLSPWLNEFVGQIISFPLPWQFLALQLGVGTVLGLFLGGTASAIAANRLLKK